MPVIKRFLSFPVFGIPSRAFLERRDSSESLYLSKLHPPGKLLDFGCADGHIADTFSGFDYHGVDIDPVAIEAARRHVS